MPTTKKPLGKAVEAKTKPARPGHGGPRAGAGRPVNPATTKSTKVAQRIQDGIVVAETVFGELAPDATPLDVMVLAMRAAYKLGGAIAAQPYARDAAPYLHARIAQIELSGNKDKPVALLFKWQEEAG